MGYGICVLVIGDVLSDGRREGRAIQDDLWGGTKAEGWSDLRFVHARSVEESAPHLHRGAVDAIFMSPAGADAIASLRARAADLPILVLSAKIDLETARNAIRQGADDVLLPADLAGEGLPRRLSLAVTRKAIETERFRHARDDAVTGLANGTLLEERFVRALARADRSATLVGLVAIELDGFDDIVARHGIIVTDRLLSMVGMRLLGATRQTDTLARTRDHGFTWLVEGLPTIDAISTLVSRLPDCLTEPFAIDGRKIRLTASGGVAIYPYHGRDFATVQSKAEAAMLDVYAISGDALLMLPMPPAPQPTRAAALL
ncbi:MAG: diguanylate cyclase domain-containing protein [Geminicoccaceae bacterium]